MMTLTYLVGVLLRNYISHFYISVSSSDRVDGIHGSAFGGT